MMSTTSIRDTRTPIATTRKTTWRSSNRRRETLIRAWPYWTVKAPRPLHAAGAFFAANLVLLGTWAGAPVSYRLNEAFMVVIGLMVCQLFFLMTGMDRLILGKSLSPFFRKSLVTLVLLVLFAGFVFFLFPQLAGWQEFLSSMAMSIALLFALRPSLRFLTKRKGAVQGCLVLGTGPQARRFYTEMTRLNASALVPRPGGPQPDVIAPGAAVSYEEISRMARRGKFSSIVIAEPDPMVRAQLAAALVDGKLRGLEIREAADSYEQAARKIWLEGLRPDLVVYSEKFRPSRLYAAVKRVLDVVLAVICVVLAAPLLLAAAAAIKLTSAGPVLFRQERVGLDGRVFRVCKFRTMRVDAEHATGPVWASADDDRITPVGQFLRRYRIDEIPQVFNVLAGDMSFVGPRPERPHFVEMLKEHVPYYDWRHYVKPGISGWAQVMYPYGASVEDSYEKMQYDLYYVKHMSVRVDLQVLIHTVRVVLQGSGR